MFVVGLFIHASKPARVINANVPESKKQFGRFGRSFQHPHCEVAILQHAL